MNAVIDAVRKKYPAYANVDDDSLTRAIGDKYPQYLKDDGFAADYSRLIDTGSMISPPGTSGFSRNFSTDAPTIAEKKEVPLQIGMATPPGQPDLKILPGGMNDPGTGREMMTEIAQDPKAFLKTTPQIALGAITAPGKLSYYTAADLFAKVQNAQHELYPTATPKAEFGGNLPALMKGESPPADTFLSGLSKDTPNLAVIGKTGKSLAEMAPLAAVGLLPAWAARLAALGFTVDMIYNAPEQFKEYAEEINKPENEQDKDKLTTLQSGILQTLAFAPMAGGHAAGGLPKLADVKYALDSAKENIPKSSPREPMSPRPQGPAEEGGVITENIRPPEVIQLEQANAPATAKVVEEISQAKNVPGAGVQTATKPGQSISSKTAVNRAINAVTEIIEKQDEPRNPESLEVVQRGLGPTAYFAVIDHSKGEIVGTFGSRRLAEEMLANMQGSKIVDVETKQEQSGASADAPQADIATIAEWNKAAIQREAADQVRPGFYQMETLTPERVSAMSNEELARRFSVLKTIIKEVAGKSGKDPAADMAKDAAYRLNAAAVYREARRRNIAKPIPALDDYLKSLDKSAPGQSLSQAVPVVQPGPVKPPLKPKDYAQDAWELMVENVVSDADAYHPARNTGGRDYDLIDAIQNFFDAARQQESSLADFWKRYRKEADITPTHTRKISGLLNEAGLTRAPKQTPKTKAEGNAPAAATLKPVTPKVTPKKRTGKADSVRAQSEEFKNLVLKHAPFRKWGQPDTIAKAITPSEVGSLERKSNAQIGPARAAQNEEAAAVKAVMQQAAKELGLDPDKLSSDLKYRAENLQKIRELDERSERFYEAIKDEGDASGKIDVPATDLKSGDVLTLAGENVTVAETFKDYVVLDGGGKFGKQTVGRETTLFVDGYEPKVEAPPPTQVPKLGAMEKGTGDLLKGQTEDFALVQEKGTDVERLQAAKEKAARDKQEAAKLEKKQQNEFVGMGGAIPSEFTPSSSSPTSIKNAMVERERAARGLPPAMEPIRRSFGQVWDEAMTLIDDQPGAQDALIAELQIKPRAVTDLEDAMLLHRQVDLQNQYGRIQRELAQAFDDSKRFPDRLEAMEVLKAELNRTRDQLSDLYDVNKKVGTETGRGLNARKMLANEDYTLASMEIEARAAKDGQPLTESELAKVAELQKKIEATQKAFDDYRLKVEQEKSNRMTDEAIAELKKQVAQRPAYDPAIIRIAEEIVGKLEKQADAARARLKSKFASMGSSPDPTIIYDLGVVGAAKIARTGIDFARFTSEMVSEFGEAIKPYMQAVWERANAHIENEGAKYGDKSPQVKNLLRKRDEKSRQQNISTGLKDAAKEGQPLDLVSDYVRKLAESFIRQGITGREPLVDAVWDVLKKDYDPGISRREAMDAISGYGKFKALNPDEIKTRLRDLKGQMQQVAKLEDIQAKKPLPKTGLERRAPSDEERRLIQQVNEAKRRFGVVVSDPARQLKSALDAVKKRLTNQISDLEYQINTRQKIVKDRSPSPADAKTKALETRRDDLKRQFEEIFPKSPMTEAQRVEMAKRNIERNIADLEARISKNDISEPGKKSRLSTPELEALRERQAALRAEYEELVNTLDPTRSEKAALSALKARLSNSTARLKERVATRDFSPRKRPEIPLDAEALKLKAENAMAREEWHKAKARWQYENLSRGRKIYEGAKEALNLPRTLWTAYDVSAVLRQGGFIGLGNPVRSIRNIGPMFKALASERSAHVVAEEIAARPNAPLYARSKLYLAPLETDARLVRMEEQIMSRLANNIPGVRPSNRAFITFLNRLRADSFDAMVENFRSRHGELNQAELEAIANYINVATGRGNLYQLSRGAETMATVFFAPRLVASRFQLLGGQPLYHGSMKTRQLIAKEYGKFLAGAGAVIGLGLLAGATVEKDPRSSDFGKLKFGDTRVDLLGGLSQSTVLLSRLGAGETKNSKGEIVPLRGKDVPFTGDTSWDVIGRFLRTKLAPVAGKTVDALSGENVIGEKVTPGKFAAELVTPLSMRDIYEAMLDQGVPRGTALGILSLFGAGLNTYDSPDASESVAKELMGSVRGLDKEQREKLSQNMISNIRSNMLVNPAYSNKMVDTALKIQQQKQSQPRK